MRVIIVNTPGPQGQPGATVVATSGSFTGSFSGSFIGDFPTGSFVTTSSFNDFTGSYNTGSFTGSFFGDGSQLTGIVSSKWSGSNPITRNSNVEITGSLKVTGGITSSLFGTASWANNASIANYSNVAGTASIAIIANTAINANYATNAGNAGNANYADNAGSASYAETASISEQIILTPHNHEYTAEFKPLMNVNTPVLTETGSTSVSQIDGLVYNSYKNYLYFNSVTGYNSDVGGNFTRYPQFVIGDWNDYPNYYGQLMVLGNTYTQTLYVQNNTIKFIDSLPTSSEDTSSYTELSALSFISGSLQLASGSYKGDYIGTSLKITGSAHIVNTSSAITESVLKVIGTGSDYPTFATYGSQGNLLTVTDNLTDSLLSVNNISGLPSFEVFSNGNVALKNNNIVYSYNNNTLSISGSNPKLAIGTSGSIYFGDGSIIQSISASSGDGYGLTTLILRPDTTYNSDQYIVLDPTAPNHIHIRAGGLIDASTSYLYLGGENNHVKVDDYGTLEITSTNTITTRTNNTELGLKLDFTNNLYSLGDHANIGNGNKLVIDNLGGIVTLSGNNNNQGLQIAHALSGRAVTIGDYTDSNTGTKIVVDDSNQTVTITGSLISPSITGSLFGTSSWTSNFNEIDPIFTAKSSSLATTGSNSFNGSQTITGSLTVTQNLTVLGSSSVVYITSSQLDVGTNTISVNVAEPGLRFGGLIVYDSGSLSHEATASLLWDSQNNHWVYQNASGSTYSGGGLISGPKNFGALGSETYPTQNRVVKGQGGDHIMDSNISDNGSLVSINSNTEVTGSLVVTSGISGSFSGSGANLSGIPASGIVGLNLSQIATGSITAAVNVNSASFAVTSGSSTFLFVSSSGNVGIGTTNPFRATLDINGTGRFANNLTVTGSIVQSISGYGTFTLNNAWSDSTNNNSIALYDGATGNISIIGSPSSFTRSIVMRPSPGAAVLIGPITTGNSTPWPSILTVSGSSDLKGNLTVTGSAIISSSNATQMLVGSNLLFVSSSGRVGIGTTSPTATLDVNGTITAGFGSGFALSSGVMSIKRVTSPLLGVELASTSYPMGFGFTRSTTAQSGVTNGLFLYNSIAFQSGSGHSYNELDINPTITEYLGASPNSIVRGVFIRPTLTGFTTTPYRAIEWNTNYGFGLFGSGSSQNLLRGNLHIGSFVTSSNTLSVAGTAYITGSLTVTGSVAISSGSITMPDRPAFRVYGAGTINNLSTTTNGDGTLNSNNFTVDYTQGTGFVSSSGIFTAPIAGLYSVHLNCRNDGNANYSQLAVLRNNSNSGADMVVMIEFGGNSTMNHAGGSSITRLAVGDTLRMKVLANTITFDGNDNWSVAYIG